MSDLPHRFDGLFTLIAGALASVSACLAAALPDLANLTGNESAILNDTQMRFACIAGALGGAVLSVLIFPPKLATHRTIAAKFFASGVSGFIFAPMTLRWLHLPRDFDTVLGCAAIVALTAIGVLRIAVPLWERTAGSRLAPPKDDGPL